MNKTTRQYTSQATAVSYQAERPPQEMPQNRPQEQKNKEVDWIGFSNKTVWDWLILFSTIAIPIAVLCATVIFSVQQEQANEIRHETDLKIANANRQNDLKMANDQEEETTLAGYLDGLTNLLLNNKLASPQATNDADIVARAKTMIVLRRLNDPHRKSMVVQFLYEARRIIGTQPRVSLEEVDLSNADLKEVNLSGTNLHGANLSGAHLNRALLRNADLRDANLNGADLSEADLSGADLRGATMRETKITSEQLQRAKVQ